MRSSPTRKCRSLPRISRPSCRKRRSPPWFRSTKSSCGCATLGARGRDGGLKEGQKVRILMVPATQTPGARLQPYRVMVANESTIEAVAALSDLGKYVAVDVQSMNTVTETAAADDDDEDDGSGVRLYHG